VGYDPRGLLVIGVGTGIGKKDVLGKDRYIGCSLSYEACPCNDKGRMSALADNVVGA